MGSGISPVLEAFLAGQKQQTGIIQQAKEVQDQVEARKNQQAALKERQAQLDEIIRQHNTEADQFHQRLDLEHQSHELEAKKAWMDTLQKGIANLRSGATPPQTGNISTSLNIPGVSADTQPQPTQFGDAPSIGGMNIPGINLQSPPINQVSPMQDVPNLNGGTSKVPMPETATQQHVNQKQMDDAADLAKNLALFKQTKEPQYLAQIDAANKRAEDSNQRARDIADGRYQLGLTLGEMRAGQKLNDLTGGLLGGPLQEHVDAAVNGAATGHYDVAKEPYPKLKALVRNQMLAKGLDPDIPDKTFASIYSTANGAVDLKNTVDAMNTAIQAPKNFTGRIADVVSGGTGYKGLGVDKAAYDTFAAKLAPTLEIASGMSPGSMRSTALLNMFKGLVRQPGNSASDIKLKDYMAVGIPLTAVSKQMSALPQEQRKLVWTQVVKDNPRLMTMYPEIAKSLSNAIQTGQFEPGKDVKDFLANANK